VGLARYRHYDEYRHFPFRTYPQKEKAQITIWAFEILVGRERFERSTNGLKVRCSTS
jgi:hypothetical protein